MFQTGLPSIIRSTIQRQAFVRPLLLPAASLDDHIQASIKQFCEVCARDKGRKIRLKHVEGFTEMNKYQKCCILLVVF